MIFPNWFTERLKENFGLDYGSLNRLYLPMLFQPKSLQQYHSLAMVPNSLHRSGKTLRVLYPMTIETHVQGVVAQRDDF